MFRNWKGFQKTTVGNGGVRPSVVGLGGEVETKGLGQGQGGQNHCKKGKGT